MTTYTGSLPTCTNSPGPRGPQPSIPPFPSLPSSPSSLTLALNIRFSREAPLTTQFAWGPSALLLNRYLWYRHPLPNIIMRSCHADFEQQRPPAAASGRSLRPQPPAVASWSCRRNWSCRRRWGRRGSEGTPSCPSVAASIAQLVADQGRRALQALS